LTLVRSRGNVGTVPVNPTLEDRSDAIEVPLDGRDGRSTEPFITGRMRMVTGFPVAYAGLPDFGSDIVTKAAGLNSELLPSTHDNTAIYRLMYQTLLTKHCRSPVDEPGPQSATPAAQETGNVISFTRMALHLPLTSPVWKLGSRWPDQLGQND